MGRFSRAELEEAFQNYQANRIGGRELPVTGRSGQTSLLRMPLISSTSLERWVGREAIRNWITKTMSRDAE